jgi:hypothetical protein
MHRIEVIILMIQKLSQWQWEGQIEWLRFDVGNPIREYYSNIGKN